MKSKVRELNTKKKELTESLVGVMKQNEIDCFDINGGSISYKKMLLKSQLLEKL